VGATGQPSVTVGVPVDAGLESAVHSTAALAGHVTAGSEPSVTLTVLEQVLVCPSIGRVVVRVRVKEPHDGSARTETEFPVGVVDPAVNPAPPVMVQS
jgi:hypothetical protein